MSRKKEPRTDAPAPSQADLLEEQVLREKAALTELKKIRRERARLEAGPEEEPEDPILEGQPLPGQAMIDEVLGELKGEGSFVIYRLGDDGRAANIGQYDLALWPAAMDNIVKAKGGGTYSIIFRDGEGHQRKRVTRTYDPVSAPQTAPQVGSMSPELLALIKLGEDRAARMEERLEAARAESAKAQREFMTSMLEMAKSKPPSIFDRLDGPSIVALVTAGAKLLRGDEKDPIERMLDLRDLMDSLKEDTVKPEGTLDKILTGLASAFIPGAAAMAGAGLGARRRLPGKTAAPAAPAAPVAPVPVRTEIAPADSTAGAVVPASAPGAAVPAVSAEVVKEDALIPMDSYVEEILKAFNNGSTPEDAAGSVYDAMEARKLLPLLRMNIERGNWDGLLKNPRIANNPELVKWVSSFREALKSEMLEPAAVGGAGDDPAPENDDDDDNE